MQRIPIIFSVAALVLALLAIFKTCTPGEKVVAHLPAEARGEEPAEHERVELAVNMGRIQRYHQKWWAAGKAGNAELAGFYLHELEEAMEFIVESEVIDEGVDISAQMSTYGIPVVKAMERKLKEEGVAAMHADAAMMANSCTACHAACGHPYLRIVEPGKVDFPDQDFRPILVTNN